MEGGERDDDQAVPDGGSAAVELQDPLSPLGQDLAALTTRQVLLRARDRQDFLEGHFFFGFSS